MNSYVLTFAIGPVQGFIASARRSRDLWAGSWLLSELAKAVARNLHENRAAELIFPFIGKDTNLLNENSKFSVGNKIQVIVNAESRKKLIKIAEQAKDAAKEHFEKIADQVWDNITHHHKELHDKIWDNQKRDYVEVQYAWARFHDENDYLNASQKAAQLLTSRKATRDFSQQTGNPLPKSSLDGARETVLLEEPAKDNQPAITISETLRNKLSLNQSEQLDCAGVVKRLCGTPEQFTPVTRVAANDWIEKIKTHANFDSVKQIYKLLVKKELATCVRGNEGIYDDFPYDAQLCYSSSLNAALLKADENEKKLLNDLQILLEPIWHKFGEPCPYFVMLLADGDRMGELLDKAQNKDSHQKITKALSKFAQSVPDIMRKRQAQCIYSGGDDVLGLMSLNHAVACANDLRRRFSGYLKSIANKLGAENPPTLSVGLAICHVQNPFGNVRALAKRAEKIAKGDKYAQPRNALGITLAMRSSSISDIRLRWDDDVAFANFKKWISAYQNGSLSSRVAYECRDIFTRTDFPMQTDDVNLTNKIRSAEFKRMLLKARDSHGKPLDEKLIFELESHLKSISQIDTENGKDWHNANDGLPENQHKTANLDKLATELIIARWLAAKTQRDLGRENG